MVYGKEISLKDLKTAKQILSTFEAGGFYTWPLYSFLDLISVTEEIGNCLLALLDPKYRRVQKGVLNVRKVILIRLFQRKRGVSSTIEFWDRNATGKAQMIWNDRTLFLRLEAR